MFQQHASCDGDGVLATATADAAAAGAGPDGPNRAVGMHQDRRGQHGGKESILWAFGMHQDRLHEVLLTKTGCTRCCWPAASQRMHPRHLAHHGLRGMGAARDGEGPAPDPADTALEPREWGTLGTRPLDCGHPRPEGGWLDGGWLDGG